MPPKPASPPHSTTLLRRLQKVDSTLSLKLYTLTQPILPHLLLKSLEISGDGFLFFPLLLSFLVFPSQTQTPTTLLLGGLLDLLLIGLLKHLFRRPRPLYNTNMTVAFAVDHFSFPSGHSSRVFFIATLLSLSREFLQMGAFSFGQSMLGNGSFLVEHFMGFVWSWAVLTSVSRILLGRHFVFDVVVGMLLGVLEGVFVFRVFNYPNLAGFFFS